MDDSSEKAVVQRCFVGLDGYMYCSAIWRNGVLITTKSGKWFRFPTRAKPSPTKNKDQV